MREKNVAPGRAEFRERARHGVVVPVVRDIPADWWTPVSAFRLLAAREPHVFLLESVEGGERVGRYSFLGRRPYLVARVRDGRLTLDGEDARRHRLSGKSALEDLRQVLGAYRSETRDPALPPFLGGAVGYFGYETVRWVESLPRGEKPPPDEDEAVLLFLEDVAAFDHVRGRLYLAANARVHPGDDPDPVYDAALARLEALEAGLRGPLAVEGGGTPRGWDGTRFSNQTREEFTGRVRRAQEYIAAGDVFQVVLSQRFRARTAADDLTLYRALRSVNPSPYMFLLRLDGWSAVGSSPEPLLKVIGDRLVYRPIAGTAPRGGDDAEDARRGRALAEDPKERAEHIMLVDLGRNDLGRCAVPGTVVVDELMTVERYSHVLHLVSGLSARLRPDLDPLDALLACFPAGTVSGAPKVRAMEIIEELEPERRGLYAGAVGYLDVSGNLDTCIALRTMVVRSGEAFIQAGAGIVADSDPEREYVETLGKAEALFAALRAASEEGG